LLFQFELGPCSKALMLSLFLNAAAVALKVGQRTLTPGSAS